MITWIAIAKYIIPPPLALWLVSFKVLDSTNVWHHFKFYSIKFLYLNWIIFYNSTFSGNMILDLKIMD